LTAQDNQIDHLYSITKKQVKKKNVKKYIRRYVARTISTIKQNQQMKKNKQLKKKNFKHQKIKELLKQIVKKLGESKENLSHDKGMRRCGGG